jgi:hypothetical protein
MAVDYVNHVLLYGGSYRRRVGGGL